MIYTAQVRVQIPGTDWAEEMQAARLATPFNHEDPGEAAIDCEKGTVQIWTLAGDEIDPETELEYDFVTYDQRRGLVVIAVFVGDGTGSANLSFDALFDGEFQLERDADDWAFLIVPVTQRRTIRVKAWAVAPTQDEAYREASSIVNPSYINRLIRRVML